MGSKTLLKTRLDFLPISKYLVSKILWRAIIFVIKSHSERQEKVSNVPTAFYVYLIPVGCDFWLSDPHFIYPLSGWGGILIVALVLAILKRAKIC